MNKLLFSNTYKKGSVTYLVLQERIGKFIGVCLEFDLVVETKTLEEAKEQIRDYAHLWLDNAVKNKLPEEVLNRPAPKKYWKIYESLLKQDLKKVEAEKKPTVNVNFNPPQVVSFQSPYPNFAFI